MVYQVIVVSDLALGVWSWVGEVAFIRSWIPPFSKFNVNQNSGHKKPELNLAHLEVLWKSFQDCTSKPTQGGGAFL